LVAICSGAFWALLDTRSIRQVLGLSTNHANNVGLAADQLPVTRPTAAKGFGALARLAFGVLLVLASEW